MFLLIVMLCGFAAAASFFCANALQWRLGSLWVKSYGKSGWNYLHLFWRGGWEDIKTELEALQLQGHPESDRIREWLDWRFRFMIVGFLFTAAWIALVIYRLKGR